MVVFDRCGPSGNIFFILANAYGELKAAGRMDEYEEMSARVKASGSYDAALAVIGEYVELVEV